MFQAIARSAVAPYALSSALWETWGICLSAFSPEV